MDGTHTTFRRLSEKDLQVFYPLYFITHKPCWKIGFILALVIVGIKWVTQ